MPANKLVVTSQFSFNVSGERFCSNKGSGTWDCKLHRDDDLLEGYAYSGEQLSLHTDRGLLLVKMRAFACSDPSLASCKDDNA